MSGIIMTRVKSMTLWTVLVILALACPVTSGGTPALVKHTIDGGGATSAAGGFVLTGTIGQPDAGPASKTAGFTLAGGFHAGGAADPCPWDCGEANGIVGIQDFLAMLIQWGQADVSCDLGLGQPGVGIEEFLSLILNWGPCP